MLNPILSLKDKTILYIIFPLEDEDIKYPQEAILIGMEKEIEEAALFRLDTWLEEFRLTVINSDTNKMIEVPRFDWPWYGDFGTTLTKIPYDKSIILFNKVQKVVDNLKSILGWYR